MKPVTPSKPPPRCPPPPRDETGRECVDAELWCLVVTGVPVARPRPGEGNG